jgi:hypothetical protein
VLKSFVLKMRRGKCHTFGVTWTLSLFAGVVVWEAPIYCMEFYFSPLWDFLWVTWWLLVGGGRSRVPLHLDGVGRVDSDGLLAKVDSISLFGQRD